MNIDVLTLFPEMFTAVTNTSILGRAAEKGIITVNPVNIRDFSNDKHNKADDTPFGGGPGMVMLADPIFGALRSVDACSKKIIYMSPRGRILDKEMIGRLACEENIVILCGHYEGVDQRVIDYWNMEEISIGDYILTGGELPGYGTDRCCCQVPARKCWEMPCLPMMSPYIQDCWNATSIQNPDPIKIWKFRKCLQAAIIR